MGRKKKEQIQDIEKRLDYEVRHYLQRVRFSHKVRGVDEAQVWTVVSNIQKYYDRKLDEERAKMSLTEQEKDEKIKRLKRKLAEYERKETELK